MTDLLESIIGVPGRLEAEVTCADQDLRAFVTVTSFRKKELLGGEQRYAYFPESQMLYNVARYQVYADLLENEIDVSESELIDLQSIVLPDKERLLVILEMWLPTLDDLRIPQLSDAPH